MIITTGNDVAGYRITEYLGVVRGIVVRATGFARGVVAAQKLDRPGDLLHAIFAARTFGLFETLPPDQLGEYLSGLLIGAEILAGARGATKATAIGSPTLTERYAQAGARLGVTIAPAPENCALLGLRALL